MVEVFKTTVRDAGAANTILTALQAHFPAATISFDLEDCDRILRIEGDAIPVETIILMVTQEGHYCEVLD